MPERKADLNFLPQSSFVHQKLLKCFLLALAIVSAAGVRAQDLGPHDMSGSGCTNCHGLTLPTSTSERKNANLWGNFDEPTYTGEAGEAMPADAPGPTEQSPSSHSEACLVCHDGSMALGMKKGSVIEGQHHPTDIPYPLGQSGYWPGSVTGNDVIFTPSHFDVVYGRPLRFYVSGGQAYIECTTCHDPHNYSVAQVTIQGRTMLKPTAYFVRGWYDVESRFSNSASQFCRSCHYEQSNEAYGFEIATM